jgi:hypothetical protein
MLFLQDYCADVSLLASALLVDNGFTPLPVCLYFMRGYCLFERYCSLA